MPSGFREVPDQIDTLDCADSVRALPGERIVLRSRAEVGQVVPWKMTLLPLSAARSRSPKTAPKYVFRNRPLLIASGRSKGGMLMREIVHFADGKVLFQSRADNTLSIFQEAIRG